MRTTGGRSPGVHVSRLCRRHRYRRIFLGGATAIATVALPGHSAVGAVSNTVVLAGGPSGQPNDVRLIAADSAAILFSVADPELAAGATTYIQPHSGVARALPARFNVTGARPPTLVGNMLGTYIPSATPALELGSFVFSTVDGLVGGASAVTAGEFLATSADGYVYSATPTATAGTIGGVHIYDVNVSSKVTTDLGAVPDNPALLTAIASPAGVLLETKRTVDSAALPSLYYVSIEAPNVFVQLAASVPVQGAPVVGTTSVAWLENSTVYNEDQSFDPTATKVARVTLGRPGVQRRVAANAYEVAVTAAYTGVLTASPDGTAASFSTSSTGGGQATFYQTPVGADLLSTGSTFVITQSGTPETAGIYTLPSAGGPAILRATAGAATLRASTIAISPARVVWRDNGVGAGLWSRGLSTAQTTLLAGGPSVISSQPDPTSEESAASSGDRVAYVASANAADSDTTSAVWVATAGQSPRSIGPAAPDDDLTLSGTRLLQRHDDGSATLTDLDSGTASLLPAPIGPWSGAFVGRTDYQLWGNELAWLASDGSVWFKDLVTGTSTQISSAVASAGEAAVGSVAVAAGIVAWTESICTATQNTIATASNCRGSGLRYRNALTLGQTYTVPSAEPTRIQLSSGYLAFDDDSNGSSWVDVTPLYSSVIDRISALSSGGAGEVEFSISGSMLGWIGADKLPHAAALPHVAANPWYLGNGTASESLVTDGAHSWDTEFITSDVLTTCAVTISSGSTTIRKLPCSAAQMAVGDAVVSWDGKNGTGSTVSPGSYTWTLAGANADGPLRSADGKDIPVAGTITTTPHSIVSLACASSSGEAYKPVTLTATVAGTGAGSVEFFDGTTSVGTSPVFAGAATLTTSTLRPAAHSMTATYTPPDYGLAATSAPVVLMLSDPTAHAGVTVMEPTNDPGTLTMTTPYTPANPLELGALLLDPAAAKLATSVSFGSPTKAALEVTDRRAGNPNWTVSLQTSDFVDAATHTVIGAQNTGITGLTAVTTPGGVLGADDITFDNVPAPLVPVAAGSNGTSGLGGKPHQLASTSNGGNGTIGFYGMFTLEAPTSTIPGAYQGTVVFTIG